MKDKSSLRYFWVTLLNIIITIAEFIGGAISGSLRCYPMLCIT